MPGPLAERMVASGAAEIADQNGKVRAVRLIETAATSAWRIGPPGDGAARGIRFYRWRNLDCGARVVEFHPRSTYEEPE